MGISISAIFGLLIILWAAVMIVRAVRIVPQQQAWVIERLGKFHGVLVSGIQIGRASCREECRYRWWPYN